MHPNTIIKDKLQDAMQYNSNGKDTSLIDTQEAASILGLSPNHFADAKNRKWPDVLRPAKRKGKAFLYRRCDVHDFGLHMQNYKPKKVYATAKKHNEAAEESNATIASMIIAKVKMEKDILVLQESHQYLCKAINHMRK